MTPSCSHGRSEFYSVPGIYSERRIVMNVSACLSVSLHQTVRHSPNFLCMYDVSMLPMAVIWVSSGGILVCL